MPRRLRRIAAALVVIALVYVAAAGAFLHRVATGILEVGPLAEALAAEDRPQDPFALGFRGTPEDAFGLRFEEVRLETPLGLAPAWFVPGDASIAALYVHGIAGSREDGYRHLSVLADLGVPSLLVSYRNDPGAPAAPEGVYAFGLSEWRDVDAALGWLKARGHDRVLLVAESMGGGIAGQLLARSGRAVSVVGLALDSPALDFPAVTRNLATRFGLPLPGAVSVASLAFMRLTEPFDYRDAAVLDTVAAFDGPIFLAHGTGDRVVPVSTSDALAKRRPDATYLRTSADHLQSWHEDPAHYSEAFGSFVAALLAQAN